MPKTIISVKNLTKVYRKSKFKAVDDISFEIKQGEFFTLLGPNGAGKTTTISILTTTLSKTSGGVNISGYDIDRQSSQVRQNIGIIFQNPSLDLNLTAEENIRFHTILYGLYPFRPTFSLMPAPYKKKILELAAILGIQNDLNKPIKTFSGGMRRKLEIVRSLIHKPKVLFLDEPTVGLDPLSRRDLWQYLKQLRVKENTTIFLTTHYLEEAEDSDQVCIINQGKIVSIGTPDQIKKNLIEEYILIDGKDRQKIEKELNILKLKFKKDHLFKININSPQQAQEVIQKIKTPLTLLRTHTPTLEEAYLEIIQRPNQENGTNNDI